MQAATPLQRTLAYGYAQHWLPLAMMIKLVVMLNLRGTNVFTLAHPGLTWSPSWPSARALFPRLLLVRG